ncbi:MAG: hypothetical protein AABY10_04795 [Nanoarchaeota archaeon]
MSLAKKILGIPQNMDEFLEKAKKERQENVRFSLNMVNAALTEHYASRKHKVEMYLSYLDGSNKIKVFETTSEVFTLTGLIPEQGEKYLEFEKRLMMQRNAIRQSVMNAGFGFEDPTQYKNDPLGAGVMEEFDMQWTEKKSKKVNGLLKKAFGATARGNLADSDELPLRRANYLHFIATGIPLPLLYHIVGQFPRGGDGSEIRVLPKYEAQARNYTALFEQMFQKQATVIVDSEASATNVRVRSSYFG